MAIDNHLIPDNWEDYESDENTLEIHNGDVIHEDDIENYLESNEFKEAMISKLEFIWEEDWTFPITIKDDITTADVTFSDETTIRNIKYQGREVSI